MLSASTLSAFSTPAINRPGPVRPVRSPGEAAAAAPVRPPDTPLSSAPQPGTYKPRGSLLNLTV